MKTIEVRHGCYAAETCGSLPSHTCGSPDACTKLKPNGVVCTFGTLTRSTFHSAADVAAEVTEVEAQAIKLFGALNAADRAAIRIAASRGKNIHSPEAEAGAREQGKAHGASNRSLHDANPSIFGHD